MNNDRDKPEAKSAKVAKDLRQTRLKLALRENLKRRNSQAKGRGDVAIASSKSDDAAPSDGSKKDPGK